MDATGTRPSRRGGGVLALAVGVVLLVVWASTTPTLGGWTAGRVANSSSSARSAKLAFTHSAGPCSLGPGVSGSVACVGVPTGTETIVDSGTVPASGLAASVSAASCGPVQLVNQVTGAGARPLLARRNVAFRTADPWSGTNAVTLDGASYASGVASQAEPAGAGTYGLGVWFRAASGSSGPMFSFGTNPYAAAGTDDRTLFLNPNGTVSFRFTASLVNLTSAVGTSYADGAWHFAYVRFSLVTAVASTFSLTVDSGTPVTSAQVLSATGTTGYWRLGWAPPALTGIGNAYFTGSLSNLVVFYAATVPGAAPTAAQRASQAAFSTWAGGATEDWLLGDSGTTTYAGTQPTIGATSPCAFVDIAWSFVNPAATAAAGGTKLSAFANGVARSVAAPGPGVTQTSTLTTGPDPGNTTAQSSYVSGLRLYVPFTYVVATATGSWPLTFGWSSNAAVVIA